MIVDIFNNAARRIVENMVTATLPKINVKSGKCRYNFRCQMNAVHDALNSGQDKIAIMFKFSTNVIGKLAYSTCYMKCRLVYDKAQLKH